MDCYNCGMDIEKTYKNHRCTNPKCGLIIWNEIWGHIVTPEEVEQLLTKGRTNETVTLISKDKKPYKAHLIIQGNKVQVELPNYQKSNQSYSKAPIVNQPPVQNTVKPNYEPQQKTGFTQPQIPKMEPDEIKVRVQSDNPGYVNLNIQSLERRFQISVNFGLASTRECECLAVIAAAGWIKQWFSDFYRKKIIIELNSEEAAGYLLKEVEPRNKDVYEIVGFTWSVLSAFKSVKFFFVPIKKKKLEGINVSETMPRGLFPWINPTVNETIDDKLEVGLPLDPSVYKQFKASFKSSLNGIDKEKGIVYYWVHKCHEEEIKQWIETVTYMKS